MASWTHEENDRFEIALHTYDDNTPDRWQQVARAVGGGKSAEEVKRHFKKLKRDVRQEKVKEVLRYYDQLDNNHAGGSSSSTNANGRSSRGGGGGSGSRGSHGSSDGWAGARRTSHS